MALRNPERVTAIKETPRRIDIASAGYLDLRSLAAYSSCSIRWLRDRLTDSSAPLPHYRVEGKILVSRAEFDMWMSGFRRIRESTAIGTIVDDVLAGLFEKKNS